MSIDPKEAARQDEQSVNKGLLLRRRELIDQIDGFINILSNTITEVNGGAQNRVVEEAICTPQMFKKILNLFDIPFISDILAKENTIFRDVLRSFINEHPALMNTVHDHLASKIDKLEEIIGPVENATHFFSNDIKEKEDVLKEVNADNIMLLDHSYTNEERLMYLYGQIRNYCNTIRGCTRKFDVFLELDLSKTFKRLVNLRSAIVSGTTQLYHERISDMYEKNKDAIHEFDKLVAEENIKKENNEDVPEADMKQKIGNITREDYQKRYTFVDTINY